ncbi:MAG: hypothetical protein ACR2NP_22325 [Pirellulaceae bacterium]
MNKQERLGQRICLYSVLLFVSAVVICGVDLLTMGGRGKLLVPLSGYLAIIFSGVILQVIGAAVPNMRFKRQEKKPGIK